MPDRKCTTVWRVKHVMLRKYISMTPSYRMTKASAGFGQAFKSRGIFHCGSCTGARLRMAGGLSLVPPPRPVRCLRPNQIESLALYSWSVNEAPKAVAKLMKLWQPGRLALEGSRYTITPRLRDSALVALFCPPGPSPMKSEYLVLIYTVRPGYVQLPWWP